MEDTSETFNDDASSSSSSSSSGNEGGLDFSARLKADSKKKKKEKKSKKEKKKKKKKHKKAADDDDDDDDSSAEIGMPDLPSPKKKKKKDKKKDDLTSPKTVKAPKDKKKKKKEAIEGMTDAVDALNLASPKKLVKKRSAKTVPGLPDIDTPDDDDDGDMLEEYSVAYFQDVLAEVVEKCEKKIKIKSEDNSKFLEALGIYYDTWYGKWENEQWLNELLDNKGSKEEIAEAQSYVDESKQALPENKKYCVKMALKIFEKLDMDKLAGLEAKLVKGAIIAQATPQALADFAAEGRENEKLIKKLFKDPKLMKEMLRHGGARNYKYGKAMKIYSECMNDTTSPDEFWERLHKKIALACALELCDPIYEFDTTVPIDPVERFKHFRDAHKNGELDPAFPHFTVWEMRQIVNCDAPNEQMKWCRSMVMNYVPYMAVLTDNKLKYTYITDSDVRIRKPTWTGSPRTYQMILSGGGNQSVNSWFGRFVLNSFGLPTWGSKHGRQEGYTRWTPEGWVSMGGFEWDDIEWQGKTGHDFKMETEARCKAPPEEYFLKLVMLQCLGDVVDANTNEIPAYEKDVLHPERFWRSLSLISLTLLFETEPEVKRTFERKGEGLVVTNVEKYLEKYELDFPEPPIKYEAGTVTIPPSHHGFSEGNTMVVESFTPGKQVLFIADGAVEYELPDEASAGKYKLTMEVCTVSAKQSMVSLHIGAPAKTLRLKVPYTVGEWQTTDPVEVDIESGTSLKFSRPKNSLGLAVKKFILTKVE